MIRVVVDTNVLVSALLQPLGPPARVLLLARDKSIEVCISAEIYAEYEEVLARPDSDSTTTLCLLRSSSFEVTAFG